MHHPMIWMYAKIAMKCASEELHALGTGGLSNSNTIVQKCIALGMKHCWSEPSMQMFLVLVASKGDFSQTSC